MVEAEPRSFVVGEQDAMIRLDHVAMHRDFEADKSGRTTIHVWVTAEATPAVDTFESIEANVEFVIYNDDQRLGSCSRRDLKFTDPEDTVEIKADDDLRIPSHEDVTHIEILVEAAKVVRATSKLKVEPA